MVEGGNSHHSHHVRTVASAEDYPLERLSDPCNDRAKADVPRPPRYPMNIANLYEKKDGKLLDFFRTNRKASQTRYEAQYSFSRVKTVLV